MYTQHITNITLESRLIKDDETGSQWEIVLHGLKSKKFKYFQGAYYRTWTNKYVTYNGLTYNAGPFAGKPAPAPRNNTIYEHERYKVCTEPTKPKLDTVIECLLHDAESYLGQSLEEYVQEYGDFVETAKMYKLARKNTNNLIGVLGLDKFYELLKLKESHDCQVVG